MNLYKEILNLKSEAPIRTSGNWCIKRFEVSEDDAFIHNMRCAMHGSMRTIKSGTYTRLQHCNSTVMSDTPAEIYDHIHFVRYARGNVLVNGLGLGLVVEGLMLNPDVNHVTIIEISADVIKLTGKYLSNKYKDKITIINADALEWKPPKGIIYNNVWHDIWPSICGDNYESMKKLHRKYGRRTKYQNSWCREEVKRLA